MNKAVAALFGLACVFVFCSLVVSGIYKEVIFSVNCKQHLKLAADSNTVELASQELGSAIKYLEDNKMTEGHCSIIINAPSNDVGFWYKNLKSSHEELRKVTPETSQLEKTNVLMKLRETLLDHREGGDSVTYPNALPLYPYQTLFLAALLLSMAMIVVSAFVIAVSK